MPVIDDLWSDIWSDIWPGEFRGIPGSTYPGTSIPRVVLTINGEAVKAEAVSWDATESFGFRSLLATITRSDALRLNVAQGAEVALWESAADCKFDGILTGPPIPRSDGKADLQANGYAVLAEKRTDPLCYQNRDYSSWQDDSGDPFINFGIFEDIEAVAKESVLFYRYLKNLDMTANDVHGLCLWQPGCTLTRYAFNITKKDPSPSWDIRTTRFTGPDGATSVFMLNHNLGVGEPTAIAETIGGTSDGLRIMLRCNTTAMTSISNIIRLRNLRVNGRHPNGTGPTGDVWTPSETLVDIGTMLGVDTSGVHTSTLNILPMWEADGNDWLTVLTSVTDLEDSHFGFYERGRLVSGFWDDSTIWYVSNGPHVNLIPNVINPQVQVSYDGPRGKPKRVLVTNASALAKYGENTYEVELPDPQADATLATAVANALLPIVSEESYTGTIQTTEYRDASGAIRPYGPRPGHRVCIEDFGPGRSLITRITSTSGAQGEPMTLGVEGAEANPDRVLIMAGKQEDRRKKGRKRHRQRARGRAGGKRSAK